MVDGDTNREWDVFISYRHVSADKEAAILQSGLKDRGITSVFRDHSALVAGKWRDQITTALSEVRVVLVIITKDWLREPTPGQLRYRLDNQDDPVRNEIQLALQSNAVVIPVLFDGTTLPQKTMLPVELQELTECQDYEVGGDKRREADLKTLADDILKILGREGSGQEARSGLRVPSSVPTTSSRNRTSPDNLDRSVGQMIGGRIWPAPSVWINHSHVVGVLESDSGVSVLLIDGKSLRMEDESGNCSTDYGLGFQLTSAAISTSCSYVVVGGDHQVVRVNIRGTSLAGTDAVDLGHVGHLVAAWPGSDYLYLARSGAQLGPQVKLGLSRSGFATWEPDGEVEIRDDWLSVIQDDCELAVVDKDHCLHFSGPLTAAFKVVPDSGWTSLDLASDGNDRKVAAGVVAGVRVEGGQYWIHLATKALGRWESFVDVPVMPCDGIHVARSEEPGRNSLVFVELHNALVGWRISELLAAVADGSGHHPSAKAAT